MWKLAVTKGETKVAKRIAEECIPLHQVQQGYDAILDSIGSQVQVVMIGEASHGTKEFYQHRAELTKRLIQEKGFNMVCWEADWPDTYRVDCWVRGMDAEFQDKNAERALSAFQRFPRWMWRNDVVTDFITWLREHNTQPAQLAEGTKRQVGVYGLDVYSLNASMEAVIHYLEKVDPAGALKARKCYKCFDEFGASPKRYARSMGLGTDEGCGDEVMQVLLDLLKNSKTYATAHNDGDALFYAQQNALVVKNAEQYYGRMLEGGDKTWNLRDSHMLDTLTNLLQWKREVLGPRKAVVWAHNSHLGDARQTYMKARKKVNLGQLSREKFGMAHTFNIGFTTYAGAVTAADSWGNEPKHKTVTRGLSGSVESLMHDAVMRLHEKVQATGRQGEFCPNFALLFRGNNPAIPDHNLRLVSPQLSDDLTDTRLERAIGVIYRPDTERRSHYFDARVSKQFDALIHLDVTRALHPLERTPQWVTGESEHIPDTFPFAE